MRRKSLSSQISTQKKLSVIYIISSANLDLNIYCFDESMLAFFVADKAFIVILLEYNDFAIVFFPKFAAKLFKYIKIINYLIHLVNSQQLPYISIYSSF